MQECLKNICKRFETIGDFLHQQSPEKEKLVDELFVEFMECFSNAKEEKLQYPKEFIHDVRLYNEGVELVHKKFADVQIRYLMLSDFYDFARLTKKYKKEKLF
jgi:isopenicillin N synthase-like dioxygenase